jgi:Spy/CpxP family protein refolding chaperone
MLVAVAGAALLAAGNAQAQRRGGAGGFGGGGGALALLQDPAVAKECEIVEGQMKDLESLQEDLREEMRDMFSELRDVPQEERREKMQELFTKAREKTDAGVAKVLMPHQVKRLKQLEVQRQMQRGGGAGGALTGNLLAERLGITEEQKVKIRAAAEKAQKEATEKIAKIRAEAEEEILSALTESQRAQMKDIMGERFQFSQPRGFNRGQGGQPGERRGPGQGRGRRGGNQPGADL